MTDQQTHVELMSARGLNRCLLVLSLAFAIAVAGLVTGCASIRAVASDPDAQALFNKAIARLEAKHKKPNPAPGGDNTQPPSTHVDEVDYASLQWTYGGFNGSKAVLDPVVRIKDLRYDKSNMYYQWAAGDGILLGATSAEDHTATLACQFHKGTDGIWRGGKFDWIRPRNLSRGLHHIAGSEPYSNWGSAAIPNPCDAAFVIVSVRTGTRSNVIKGRWQR